MLLLASPLHCRRGRGGPPHESKKGCALTRARCGHSALFPTYTYRIGLIGRDLCIMCGNAQGCSLHVFTQCPTLQDTRQTNNFHTPSACGYINAGVLIGWSLRDRGRSRRSPFRRTVLGQTATATTTTTCLLISPMLNESS